MTQPATKPKTDVPGNEIAHIKTNAAVAKTPHTMSARGCSGDASPATCGVLRSIIDKTETIKTIAMIWLADNG
jgi:hypothetical protein